MTDYTEVVCPTCGEIFSMPSPGVSEVPCEWDYDCEICCAPMRIVFAADGDGVAAEAHGLGE